MRCTAAENSGAMYWSEDGVGKVLSCPTDQDRLNWVARRGLSTTRPRRTAGELRQDRCPNSDIEYLESSHRGVSNSHQVLTRK